MADQSGIGDFIFGTLATTEDRLNSVVNSRRGLSGLKLDRVEESVRLSLTAGPDAPVEEVVLYFTTDGSNPVPGASTTHERNFSEYAPQWDTLVWGYLRRFEATIPVTMLPEGAMLRYRAEGYTHSGTIFHAGDGKRYSHILNAPPPPAWVKEAILYHIFVDRFAPPSGKSFATHDNLAGFYGGTLRGVIDQLGYIKELGVNCIWLSPIFTSPSHHGYDSTDFREIEPRLGTKADLKELVEKAHGMGIRVLLDFVPNHVSNEHPFFKSAVTDPHSPYRHYFKFTHWPDHYETFFGVKTLPQLDNDYPPTRQYTIDSAVYWMKEFGIDGYRLDYAHGPSHDFWADYFLAVKSVNPDSFHFGEIVETPELLTSFAQRMDGALDFHFLAAIRKTFAYDTMNVEAFDDWLNRHLAYFRKIPFVLPTFLDNHDMNRYLWVVQGDQRRLKLAALVQFTLPMLPIIYYGTESGLSQLRDLRQSSNLMIMEEARLPMNWDSTDDDLTDYYRKLIALRKQIAPILQDGSRTTLIADAGSGRYGYGYYSEKFDGELAIVVLINHSGHASRLTLETPGGWRNLLTDELYLAGKGLSLRFEPYSGTVLMRE
jgi:glycosidase